MEKTALGIVLAYFCVLVLLAAGWIMNLVAFCRCDFEAPYKAEAIRGVSVFVPPIGGIVGYINIEDGNNDDELGTDAS